MANKDISPQGYRLGNSPRSTNPFWDDSPSTVPNFDAEATVDNSTGTPEVNTTTSYDEETDTYTFNFDFKNLKGETGAQGAQGERGEQGAAGAQGPAGVGVPAGGTIGQILAKLTGTDFDTQWIDDFRPEQIRITDATCYSSCNNFTIYEEDYKTGMHSYIDTSESYDAVTLDALYSYLYRIKVSEDTYIAFAGDLNAFMNIKLNGTFTEHNSGGTSRNVTNPVCYFYIMFFTLTNNGSNWTLRPVSSSGVGLITDNISDGDPYLRRSYVAMMMPDIECQVREGWYG